MNALRKIANTTGNRMMIERDAAEYVGMGRTSFRAWAKEIGAKRNFGKSVRYDRKVIDSALDAMTDTEPDESEVR